MNPSPTAATNGPEQTASNEAARSVTIDDPARPACVAEFINREYFSVPD
ncbi:MAG: hypothetical protein ACOZCP_14975 [Pseudomonadota bacterium]